MLFAEKMTKDKSFILCTKVWQAVFNHLSFLKYLISISIVPLVQYIACGDRNTISQHGSKQRTWNLINGRLISYEWV